MSMLDLDSLNYKERESYQRLLNQFKINQMTIDDFKEAVVSMLFSSLRDLVETPDDEGSKEKNIKFKARCKNYLVFYDMFTNTESINKQLEEARKKVEDRLK